MKIYLLLYFLFFNWPTVKAQQFFKQTKSRYATIDIFSLEGKGKGRKIIISYKNDSIQVIKHNKAVIKKFMVTQTTNGLLLTLKYFLDSEATIRIDSSYHNDSMVVRLSKLYNTRDGVKIFKSGRILIFSKINDKDVSVLFCNMDIKKQEPMLMEFIKNNQVNLFCSGDDVYCNKVLGGILKDEYKFKRDIKLSKVLLEELFFTNLFFGVLECKDL